MFHALQTHENMFVYRVWQYTGNTVYREMKSIPVSIIVNTGYRHSSYLHFSVA